MFYAAWPTTAYRNEAMRHQTTLCLIWTLCTK